MRKSSQRGREKIRIQKSPGSQSNGVPVSLTNAFREMKGFSGGLVVKNSPANAGDKEDVGLVSGSGRSLEKKMATHLSILAQQIPWTEESGRLQPMGLQRVRHDLATKPQQHRDEVGVLDLGEIGHKPS